VYLTAHVDIKNLKKARKNYISTNLLAEKNIIFFSHTQVALDIIFKKTIFIDK